ncbi:Kinesin-like protein KIF3A [Orchesella cincta]|uniref:Kinesin-like protein n=1 Tax=Orchesella cincta TaxID=48709 RepID=A0A1D2NDJ4_ORCCI|nr:Kinesin-like protein KIF3A [Orchesella cincta]
MNISSAPSENIKVAVRCRPISRKEEEGSCRNIVDIDTSSKTVTVFPPTSSDQPKSFSFDHVFPPNATQDDVYNAIASPIVQNVLDGYNGTIFAYGQTGTGKTFTMEGDKDIPHLKGIIPKSFAQIYRSISETGDDQSFLVRCSYLEIYNENIIDLLSKDQNRFLELKENKDREVYVKDLSTPVVVDADDMDRVMRVGNKNRSVASTKMNSISSRSHAIFSIYVECSTDAGPTKESFLRMGKLNLVDLAGSERISKTHASGDRLKEATKINLSLSSLGNVISALVDGSSHIPYRNSKLTRLLQDSLGGNSKTVMVATIGPVDYNLDETVNTLRYANRAKEILNCAKINEDPKDAILRKYQEEILHLRSLLEQKKLQLQQSQNDVLTMKQPSKKKKQEMDQKIFDERKIVGELLEEQNRVDQKYKDELKALLAPYGIDAEESPATIFAELEKRKLTLMKNGEVVKEDNERLLEEIQQATDAMINSKRQCKELFHRVMSLESQLLKVNQHNLLQQTKLKDEELKTKEKELEEQKMREASLRKTLELKKLTSNDLKAEVSKLQEEIEMKQKKVNKFVSKLSDFNETEQNMQVKHKESMEQLKILRAELTKELKLKKLIVDNFIPRKILKKIEQRIRYNDVADKYELAPRNDTSYEQPPVNRMLVNPYLNLTRFTRLSKINNVYFSNENLLAVEPEPFVPRSQELVLEEEDPRITNLIAETMKELNSELVIVCDHRRRGRAN